MVQRLLEEMCQYCSLTRACAVSFMMQEGFRTIKRSLKQSVITYYFIIPQRTGIVFPFSVKSKSHSMLQGQT